MSGPPRALARFILSGLAPAFLGAVAAAQEPLFTFVQVSDSQPQTTADNQAFVDVLRTIAEAGQPGKLLPRPVDLVLFAGDITWGNTHNEWIAATQKLDSYLTANAIPYLAVPGNHDVNNSDTALYAQYIADPGVWDVGSASFTGHNGQARTTFWHGLRFIGVNNSNPGWNTIPSADVATVAARVQAAAAAGENAFILCHHPHDDKERMPLAGVLSNLSLVGYLHGHAGSPSVTRGLAGVNNPNVWDADSNAIYDDRGLLYFEVFATQLRAHVVVLNTNPTSLPAPVIVPLAHPMTLAAEPSLGFAGPPHRNARSAPTSRAPERKLWYDAGAWWGILWSDAAEAYRIQRLERASQTWVDTGPSVSSTVGRSFDALPGDGAVVIASNLASSPAQAANGSPGQLSRYSYVPSLGRYTLDANFPVTISDARSATLVLARDGLGTLWAAWTRSGTVFVAHTLGSDAQWSPPLALAGGLGSADTVALASFGGFVGAFWSDSNAGDLVFARHFDGASPSTWSLEVATSQAELVGPEFDLTAEGGRALAAVRAGNGTLNLFERTTGGDWNVHALAAASDGLRAPTLAVDRAFGLLRLFATGPTPGGQSVSGGGAIWRKTSDLSALDFPPGRGTPVVQDGTQPSCSYATTARADVQATSGLAVLASVAQTEVYWHAFDPLSTRPVAPVTEFSAGPLSGPAPLLVDFRDLSSGGPTYWEWDFGDGQGSNESEPQHAYAATGTYTVTLRTANGAGADVRARVAYVQVTAPAPVQVFRPVADARVNEASPTSKAGLDPVLRVKSQAGASYQTFLRFDLGTLPGSVTSAKLRLFCTDSSNGGGSVYRVADTSWSETGISWSNRPPLPASSLATMGGVTLDFWSEIELGPTAVGSGLVSLAVAGGTTNSAYYSSREGAHPPELVLTFAGSGSPPAASFTSTAPSGSAPLAVSFTDTSTGAPNAWSWDFGDGTGSSARNPTHTYDQPGLYTVTLDASNGNGLDSITRLDYVTVGAPPPVRTFAPVADARVSEGSVSKNYGTETTLRVRSSSGSSQQSFLRFDLSSLTAPVVSARLRLYCTNGSNAGGAVYSVAGNWTESGLTWSNRPVLPANPVAALGAVAVNTWQELDVTGAVSGTGLVSLALAGGSTDMATYSSRQGTNPPELIVETGGAVPPVADFSAAPVEGSAPLAVVFSDRSTGAGSWQWDFGDGTSSSERNPSHVYTVPGAYSVSLVVENALGSDQLERGGLVNVFEELPVRIFLPVADARANEAKPGSGAGSDSVLRVRQSAGGSYHTYLRFDLAGLSGPVLSAELRLFSTDGSNVAGLVYPTSASWTEAGLTWNNEPGPTGPLITSSGTVATGAWAVFDVSSVVTGAGTLNFVLESSSTNSCYYSSREGAHPPELVVTVGTPQ